MASLNKIAQAIADSLGKPFDVMLMERLKFSIVNYRAKYLRQDYGRNKSIDRISVQDLGCIPLIKVDEAECCKEELGCKVKKTKLEIPKPIRLKGKSPFLYVGSIDKMIPFTFCLPEELPYTLANKYTAKTAKYSYIDGYIRVYNQTATKINIASIFEDPREVELFKSCENSDCYSDDDEFPIPADMIEDIMKEIIKGNLPIVQLNEQEEVKING